MARNGSKEDVKEEETLFPEPFREHGAAARHILHTVNCSLAAIAIVAAKKDKECLQQATPGLLSKIINGMYI